MNKEQAIRLALGCAAFFLVSLGQPGTLSLICPLVAGVGYACFFLAIIDIPSRGSRFLAGLLFFGTVQLVQLYWFTSHPYGYIWLVYLLLSLLMGAEWGLLSIFATRARFSSVSFSLGIAACWMLLEWSRLFWLSGFPFNPIGLALTAPLAPLQLASLLGVYGLSFWVMFTNALFVRAIILARSERRLSFLTTPIYAWCAPYLIGGALLTWRLHEQADYDALYAPQKVLIVHSAQPPDALQKDRASDPAGHAFAQWRDILQALAPYHHEKVDFLLLPEGSVPLPAHAPLLTAAQLDTLFSTSVDKIPFPPEAYSLGPVFTSCDVGTILASFFQCPVIIGLEGTEYSKAKKRWVSFNSAFCFLPDFPGAPLRYDKQVLVPMGEYLPFEWTRSLARHYGIVDSFVAGTKAHLFPLREGVVLGPSICYEETFGHLMRANKAEGATLLVNLTDDYWYPHSALAVQHFVHAIPRTVENGLPLIRACNFGVSGAVDSLGQVVTASFGTPSRTVLPVEVSSYRYNTLYTHVGNTPIVLLSVMLAFLFGVRIIRD